MQSKEQIIAEADILKNISHSSIQKLADIASIRRVEKGQSLFHDKEQINHLYLLIEGMASLYKMNSFGERKVIFVYGEGQLLNEEILQDLPASVNCDILEAAALLVFPKNQFLKIMYQDPQLTKAVLDSMALKIRRLYRQLKNTTNATRGHKRIAAKLWKLAHDNGTVCEQGVRINMDLSITYLADMLGSKRETVSRQLKMLTEEGVLRIEQGQFIIPDPDKLSAYFKK